jgi:hypothetical protein
MYAAGMTLKEELFHFKEAFEKQVRNDSSGYVDS